MTQSDELVYEDDEFLIERCDGSPLPGYLVLRLHGGARGQSAGTMAPQVAGRLGAMLARAVAAIEAVVGPERVYILSFCEVERNLHFHLFPRTEWLRAAYEAAHGHPGDAVNGPRLFEWARTRYREAGQMPADQLTAGEAIARIREMLESQSV